MLGECREHDLYKGHFYFPMQWKTKIRNWLRDVNTASEGLTNCADGVWEGENDRAVQKIHCRPDNLIVPKYSLACVPAL